MATEHADEVTPPVRGRRPHLNGHSPTLRIGFGSPVAGHRSFTGHDWMQG